MNEHVHELIAGSTEGDHLRLRMAPDNDGRIASAVTYVGSVGEICILQSVAGELDDAWPPSPPVQECRRHDRQPNVLLTTGMAGTSHWATSIEAHHVPPQIHWDVACRIRRPPLFLGSEFTVVDGVTTHSGEIQVCLSNSTRLEIECEHGELRLEENILRLVVKPLESELPATHRWKFTVRLMQLPGV